MSDFLILHGWGGNKPDHWQEHLAGKLRAEGQTVHAPPMPEPMSPSPSAWMNALHDALRGLPEDAALTVLAHSLGAINWMHHAAMAAAPGFERPGPVADRVLLAAPPYVIREIPPLDAPPGAADFFPPPLSPAANGPGFWTGAWAAPLCRRCRTSRNKSKKTSAFSRSYSKPAF